MVTTVIAKVTGKVQGVGFRWWTRARARRLGLAGWVKNDETGSVSAVFQGNEADIETMVTELWTGPGAAAVRDVRSTALRQSEEFEDFTIRR